MRLNPEQIAAFGEQGYLHVQHALTEEDLQSVIDEIDTMVDQWAEEFLAQGKIEEIHADEPFETRYGLIYAQCDQIGEKLDIMYSLGRAMFEFLHNDNLLDVAGSIVGNELTCNPIQHLRAKPPVKLEGVEGPSFHTVPWHQDAGVMMPEAEETRIVTCWLPLVDATLENGCMQVLPGRRRYLRHDPMPQQGVTTVSPAVLPQVDPVPLPCKKGDVLLFDKFTPHSSTPNYSNICRWSLDLRYQRTGDHTGRTAYPEFVARSPSNPESVLRDYDEWCFLWKDAFENPRGMAVHRTD